MRGGMRFPSLVVIIIVEIVGGNIADLRMYSFRGLLSFNDIIGVNSIWINVLTKASSVYLIFIANIVKAVIGHSEFISLNLAVIAPITFGFH